MRPHPMFIVAALLLLSMHPLSAQDAPDSAAVIHQEITLLDGTEAVGVVVSETESEIVFRTVSGITMTIPRAQIKEIQPIAGRIVGTTFYPADPNYTRLFFAPTAHTLEGGQGYFAAYEIFFPWVGVGVADFLTLAGGISLFPAAESQLYYIAPKVRLFESDQFNIAGGSLHMGTTKGDPGLGIGYCVGTYSSQSWSLTGGIGYGYSGEDMSDEPMFMLGGELQVSSSVKLISENWFFPGAAVDIYGFGIRFFGRSLAADFALMKIPLDDGGFPFLPWISFVYNFGTDHIRTKRSERSAQTEERRTSPLFRFSFEFMFLDYGDDYLNTLHNLNIGTYYERDYIFTGEKEGTISHGGTRIALTAEYLLTDRLGIGLGVTSYGSLGGSPETFDATKTPDDWTERMFFTTYILRKEHTLLSGSVLATYEVLRFGSDEKKTAFRIGAGAGLTDVAVEFKSVPDQLTRATETVGKITDRKPHYLLFAVIEQHLASFLTIGLRVESFRMAEVHVPAMYYDTGIPQYDSEQNPPVLIGTYWDSIPAHNLNFNAVRFGVTTTMELP